VSTPTAAARRQGGDLKTAILRAARRLYLAGGADAVSARKIAQAVGVSATTIYLHFDGIDDLLEHLRMEGHAILAEYLRGVDADLPALDGIRAMGRAYHRFGVENPAWFTLMFPARSTRPPRREAVQREMFTLMLLRDRVQRGVDAGQLRRDVDVMVATNALWAQIHGVTALTVAGLLPATTAGHADDVREATLDAVVAWLAPAEHR
jgi:AcrR family transcriptional regulator